MANDAWVNSAIGLNLRDAPNGTLIVTLNDGAHIMTIGSPNPPDANGDVWQQVRTDDNRTGWIASIIQGTATLSTTNPGTSTIPSTTTDVWITSDNGLNFRDKPGGTLIAILPYGQHLTTIGSPNPPDANGTVFQQVKTDNGQTGYVAAVFQNEQLLSTTNPAATTSATTTSTVTTTPSGDVWINSSDGLNFRDKPGGTLIATLSNRQHLTTLGAADPPDTNGTIFQQVKTDDGQTGYVAAFYQGAQLLSATKPIGPASVVPWGKCYAGLGIADPRPFNATDRSAIQDSKIEAFKIFTLGDPDETKSLITDLRRIRSDMFIVGRLFFSTNVGNKFSAQDFVNYCRIGLDASYQMGVEYFEVHNEPNLPQEGLGGNWADGAGFGAWLTKVLNILRASGKYPNAKWGYPGLSPQFGNASDTDAFLDGSASALTLCDWVGVHCYWQTPDGPNYPMTGPQDGMFWQHYRTRYPDKLLMITEFSNNVPGPADDEKGRQYARYYQALRHEYNLGAAFSFAVNWPGQDSNKEGWVYNGNKTRIGSTVGSIIASQGLG